MAKREKQNATNDNIKVEPDALTDLQVADQQADETKGSGTARFPALFNAKGTTN